MRNARPRNFKCEHCENKFTTRDQRDAHAKQRHPGGAVWHAGDCTTTLRDPADVALDDPPLNRNAVKALRYVTVCDQHGSWVLSSDRVRARKFVSIDFCPDCRS